MLKPKLTTAPNDDLKGAYVQKGDEWILDGLAEDHPKMLENKTLIEEKRTAEAELGSLKANFSNLERERDEAKAKSLPNGHRAVPLEIAELGQAAKSEGFTKESLTETKTKIETFENAEKQKTVRDTKAKALKIAGVTDTEAFFNIRQSDSLDFDFETVDGAEKAFVVAEKDGVKTKTAFDKDYLSKADGFKNIIPVLFAEQQEKGFQFSGSGANDSTRNLNPVDKVMAKYSPPSFAEIKQ